MLFSVIKLFLVDNSKCNKEITANSETYKRIIVVCFYWRLNAKLSLLVGETELRIERITNAKKGITTGVVSKISTHLMPFFVQTALIQGMGMEYVGLQGVFSSILSVLSVAELGIGNAIVYSMYEPISKDNEDEICALLAYYRKIYRIIGFAILLLGILILPFVGMITGELEDVNIYVIFFLYLINAVLSYFLYAYKSSLLVAHQRTDISNNVGTIVCIIMSVAQIMAIMMLKNFYIHLIIAILFTIINNIIISINVDRLFPEYVCKGKISELKYIEIKKNVKGLMIAKVCGTTRNMFDSIFISVFFGVVVAGIYSNYYYVLNAASAILGVIVPAIIGGVGNSIKLDSVEKNLNDMTKIDFVYMIVSGWCAVAMVCLYQPFMSLWAGIENVFAVDIAVLFTLYFYIKQMGNIRAVYSDAAGLFWENRYRTLAEALSNVILNYVLIMIMGVRGVVIATILTVFFLGFLGSAEVLFRCYFKKGLKKYLLCHLKYFCVTVVIAMITYLVCCLVKGDIIIILCTRILICIVIPAFLFFLVYSRSKMLRDIQQLFKQEHS